MPIHGARTGGGAIGPGAHKDKLRVSGGRKSPSSRRGSPPRAAKGSASIAKQREVEDLTASRVGLMRYRVHPSMRAREKVWMTLDDPAFINDGGSVPHLATWYAYFSIFLILFSSTALILQDELNCTPKVEPGALDGPSSGHAFVTAANCASWEAAWRVIEVATVVCFTVELLARFGTAPDRRRFARGLFNWVDLLAVLPFYIEEVALAVRAANAPPEGTASAAAAGTDDTDTLLTALSVLRVLRLARVFKLLKMGSASESLQLVASTAGAAMADSSALLVALLMVTLISMVVFSAALAQFEPGTDYTAPPSEPAAWFLSVTRSCWWSMVTLTGVGYGDEYPMHALGRGIAVVCATVGIIIVAVPIEVIGRYFGQHFQRHVYSRQMESECEVDGRLNVPVLLAKLQRLGRQGLLKVATPDDAGAIEALVDSYDGKGDRRLEHDEWAALIDDVVSHRGDWEGCALRRTVDYLDDAKDDVARAHELLDAAFHRQNEQHAELVRLVKARYPNGVPRRRRTA